MVSSDLVMNELSEFMDFLSTPPARLNESENSPELEIRNFFRIEENEFQQNEQMQRNIQPKESVLVPLEDGYCYDQRNAFVPTPTPSPNERYDSVTPPPTPDQSHFQDWEINGCFREQFFQPEQQFFNGRNEVTTIGQHQPSVKIDVLLPQMKSQSTTIPLYNFGELNNDTTKELHWKIQKIADYTSLISKRTSSTSQLNAERLYQHTAAVKRKRTFFTTFQMIELHKAFEENINLCNTRTKYLASRLNLSERQVKVWFQNQRQRLRRDNKRIRKAQGKETPKSNQESHNFENINENSGIQFDESSNSSSYHDSLHHYQPVMFQNQRQKLRQDARKIREAQSKETPESNQKNYNFENINENRGMQFDESSNSLSDLDRLHHCQPVMNEFNFQQYNNSQQKTQYLIKNYYPLIHGHPNIPKYNYQNCLSYPTSGNYSFPIFNNNFLTSTHNIRYSSTSNTQVHLTHSSKQKSALELARTRKYLTSNSISSVMSPNVNLVASSPWEF